MLRAAGTLALGLALLGCARPPRPARADARPPRVARLWFLGDVHGGQSLEGLFDPRGSLPRALSGESGFLNLEGPAQRDAPAPTEARLLNDARVLPALRAAGARFVSIANNHAQDNGPEGVARTASLLREASLEPLGERPDAVTVSLVDGVRVAWVAWDLSRGVPTEARATLARARREAPVRVLSAHVTAPPLYTPPPRALREAVALAVEQEFTVVLAHGTHTVAPLTREGRTLVAWGLGNAIFHCECSRETEGLLLRVYASEDGATRAWVAPLEAGLDGRPLVFGGGEGASFGLLRALGVRLREEGAQGAW